MNENVIIWKWNNAPDEYKKLTMIDGHEEWLVFVKHDSRVPTFSDFIENKQSFHDDWGWGSVIPVTDGHLIVFSLH